MDRTSDFFSLIPPHINTKNRFVHKDTFILESLRIKQTVSNFSTFLTLAYNCYLNISRHIPNSSLSHIPLQLLLEELPLMSDIQKDHLDSELIKIIKQTIVSIRELEKFAIGPGQVFQCRQGIVKNLEFSLMSVAEKHKEMQDYRIAEIQQLE